MKIRGPISFNNTIVSAFHVSCANDNGELQSCIRLLKLTSDRNDFQTSIKDFAANGADVFYPSLSINKYGNIVMVFGMSNQQIYPSRLMAVMDQNLTTTNVNSIVKGTANTNVRDPMDDRPRYGDYFSSAIDPIDGSVWVSGEYGDINVPRTPLKWSTFVANVS